MKARAQLILERHHRHCVWLPSLWLLGAGLALGLALTLFGTDIALRGSVLGATILLAAVFRFWPRRTVATSARRLDAAMAARNRFEAISELGARDDVLAMALRAEVDDYVALHLPPRPYAWASALLLVTALLAAHLTVFVTVAPRASAPTLTTATSVAIVPPVTTEPEPPTPKPIPTMPEAALRWIAPASEIFANPKEEIPLSAEAESGTGLRAFTLNVALNGETRPPLPLLLQTSPGVQPITATLLLESIEARPYDIVTYWLTAARVRPDGLPSEPSWPGVVSPLQLIQLQALRDDSESGAGGTGIAGNDTSAARALAAIQRLKREQLDVLREIHALSAELTPRNTAAWRERLGESTAQQTTVRQRLTAARAAIAAAGLAKEATEFLTQADVEIGQSLGALEGAAPERARAFASRALARLGGAEQIAAQAVRTNRANRTSELAEQAARAPTPGASELPSREFTPAGRLEQLTGKQQALVERLAARPDAAELFTEQARIARQLSQLTTEQAFTEELLGGIAAAAANARDGAGQFSEQDILAGTEPATRAAQILRESTSALESAGRARTADELLAAQRSFIRAATDLELASREDLPRVLRDAGARVATTQSNLLASARKQQQIGSAQAARNAQEMAQAIAQSEVARELAAAAGTTPAEPARQAAVKALTDLAQRSATQASELETPAATEKRALEELQRTRANLARLASERAAGTREEAAELYEKTVASAQQLRDRSGGGGGAGGPGGGTGQGGDAGGSSSSGGDGGSGGRQGGGDSGNNADSSSTPGAGGNRPTGSGDQGGGAGQSSGRGTGTNRGGGNSSASERGESGVGGQKNSPQGGGGSPASGSGAAFRAGGAGEQSGSIGPAAAGNSGSRTDGSGAGSTTADQAIRPRGPVVDFGPAGQPTSTARSADGTRGVQTRGPPPPPGPGAGSQEVRTYAAVLLQRVEGLIQLHQPPSSTQERAQVLTTGNPADAPPAYRPAVADYFEALARGRTSPSAP